jgi:hypothetical protein
MRNPVYRAWFEETEWEKSIIYARLSEAFTVAKVGGLTFIEDHEG